jgi:hypothetical protein
MDDETLNLLKTSCAAGSVRPSFNGNSNERLEQLQKAGLLDVVDVPGEGTRRRERRFYYRPTKMGREMCRKLSEQSA